MANRARGVSGKSRFTLWLPDPMMEQIARLQQRHHKENAAEVVREALNVYLELLRAREDGVELFFSDAKRGEEGRIWLLPGKMPGGRKPRPK